MARWKKGVLGSLLLAYPFIVYFGLQRIGLSVLAPVLVAIFVWRAWSVRDQARHSQSFTRLAALLGLALVVVAWLVQDERYLLYYPVVVNLVLLLSFVWVLRQPTDALLQLAHSWAPSLPGHASGYLRSILRVWVVFFGLNACVSLYTVLRGDLELWIVYNGIVAYSLVAVMLLGVVIARAIYHKRKR